MNLLFIDVYCEQIHQSHSKCVSHGCRAAVPLCHRALYNSQNERNPHDCSSGHPSDPGFWESVRPTGCIWNTSNDLKRVNRTWQVLVETWEDKDDIFLKSYSRCTYSKWLDLRYCACIAFNAWRCCRLFGVHHIWNSCGGWLQLVLAVPTYILSFCMSSIILASFTNSR